MENLEISPENKKDEDAIFSAITECIDNSQNFVFDAGAGAGKTYTLVQSLKYILSRYISKLKKHNQLIRCITYTNIAAKEIKERLGNTDHVKVSTIHDFLWEEINSYQEELVDIHKNYIQTKIIEMEKELQEEKWAEFYRNIKDKSAFDKLLYENEDLYYKNKYKKAAEFTNVMNMFEAIYLKNNVTNFRPVADNVLKINKYAQTIENITNKVKNNKVDYTKVTYNSQISYDRLASMQFSHDTLLEYSLQLIKNYKNLQKIISDKYPYILVDEYQDTNSKVVNILEILTQYASSRLLIGYYGDKKQKIYDTGVGNIAEKLKDFRVIKKEYNRRSAKKIIDIGTLIRNDDLKQKTIYNNCPEGQVSFYMGQNIDDFINFFHKAWSISQKKTLDCLLLKNEDIARKMGFEQIYDFFKNSPYYKSGKNYSLLREHVLSKEPEKLGKAQLLFYYLIDFRYKLNNPDTLIQELINKNVLKKLSIKELKNLVAILKNIQGTTFKGYILSFFRVLSNENKNVEKTLQFFIKEENISNEEQLENYLLDVLFKDYTDNDNSLENRKKIEDFLNWDIECYNNWYKYISDKGYDDIRYHTYHGTKGDEFDNVLIIMENDFGRNNKNFFGDLIRKLSDPSKKDDEKVKEARNLFYVAVTRAKDNLAILYTGQLDEAQKSQIKNIFGEIDGIKFQ